MPQKTNIIRPRLYGWRRRRGRGYFGLDHQPTTRNIFWGGCSALLKRSVSYLISLDISWAPLYWRLDSILRHSGPAILGRCLLLDTYSATWNETIDFQVSEYLSFNSRKGTSLYTYLRSTIIALACSSFLFVYRLQGLRRTWQPTLSQTQGYIHAHIHGALSESR